MAALSQAVSRGGGVAPSMTTLVEFCRPLTVRGFIHGLHGKVRRKRTVQARTSSGRTVGACPRPGRPHTAVWIDDQRTVNGQQYEIIIATTPWKSRSVCAHRW